MGEPREHFALAYAANNGHMFGNTRLDLPDDQVSFVANKLYDSSAVVVNGAAVVDYHCGDSGLAEEKDEAAI